MTKVLIFGVFDGLHAGHKFLFKEAHKHGDKLVVALAPDDVVFKLKRRVPKFTFVERLEHLKNSDQVSDVVEGDRELSSWGILEKVRPDVIVLGYDQRLLKEYLLKHIIELGLSIKIIVAMPFEPDKYHSSLINK